MAEPARNLYDDEKPEDEYAPNFGVIEGGGETTDREKGHLRSVGGKEDLAAQEDAAAGEKTKAGKGQEELSALKDTVDEDDDDDNSLFNDEGKTKGRFRGWSTRKKAVAGALGVGGIGAFFLTFMLGSVPLQIIQMSQILQSNETNNQETSDARIGALYRFARSGGDVGQTRLSARGSRSVAKSTEALAEIGVNINQGSRFFGEFGDVTIDASKFPNSKGVSDEEEIIQRISKEFPDANISRVADADGLIFRLTGDGTDKFARNMIDRSVGLLDGGSITTGMKARALKQYLNLPSLWHPIKRATSSAENRLGGFISERSALRERARELQSERAAQETAEASAAKAHISETTNAFRQGLVAALTVTGAACTIHDSATDVVVLNRARIVTPAVIEAAHIISLGAQLYTGQDINWEDLNATVESWTDDNGKSVWDAKALNATAGDKDPGGPDITNENKQAFAGDTTVDNIQGYVDSIPGIPELCTTGGQIVQAVASVLILVGTGGSGATASTFSKVVITRAITIGIKEAAKQVIYSIVQDMITHRLEQWISDDPFFELPPSGPLGGNMLAYGAREMSNITARASGGVALSDTETAAIDRHQIEKQRDEFKQKSFATRMFDLKDYRSFASITMRNLVGNPVAKSSASVTNLAGVRSLFSNLSTILLPQANAALETNYDWFSPRYGIPKAVLDNPEYADPYAVGDSVAGILNALDDSNATQQQKDYAGQLKDRAQKCFGVSISKGTEGWGVVADKDINPGLKEYTDSNCTEDSNDWHKMMLFVNDSMDAAAVSCFVGADEVACEELGFTNDGGGSNVSLNGVTCPENLEEHPTQSGYFKMPDAPNGEYTIYSTEARRYGSKQLVCVLYSVGMAYAQIYGPGESVLYIGDLNASGHKSHYKGVAVDVDAGCPEAGCKAAADHTGNAQGTYDTQATKDLAKLFIDTGVIKNIWWCPTDDSLDYAKGYADSIGKSLVGAKCISGHQNHFHIDISDEFIIPGSFTP